MRKWNGEKERTKLEHNNNNQRLSYNFMEISCNEKIKNRELQRKEKGEKY